MDTAAMQRLAELPPAVAARLAVVVSVEGSAYRGPGAARLWPADAAPVGVVSGGCLEADLDLRPVPPNGRGTLVRYDLRGGADDPWGLASGCNGAVELWLQAIPAGRPSPYRSAARWLAEGRSVSVTTLLGSGTQWAECDDGRVEGRPRPVPAGERAFIDRRRPAPLLLVFGGGPDAAPLAEAARRAGLRVWSAHRGQPDLAVHLRERPPDAAVIMSHHFPSDQAALAAVLRRPPRYVGVLGPRLRTERLLPGPWPDCLYAPVGLDVGAESAEEIAVAVLAQVLAVLRGAAGGHLRDRDGPIHPRRDGPR